jgi:hypothetical protein
VNLVVHHQQVSVPAGRPPNVAGLRVHKASRSRFDDVSTAHSGCRAVAESVVPCLELPNSPGRRCRRLQPSAALAEKASPVRQP